MSVDARYLKAIRKTKPMSKDEEIKAVKDMMNGDNEARNKLVMANMKFILAVALNYKNAPMPVEDLLNEGVIGFCKGLETYDPDRGNRVITYCKDWTRAAITQAIHEKSNVIRIPVNKINEVTKMKKENRTDGKLQGIAGMNTFVNIDGTVGGEDGGRFADIIPDTKEDVNLAEQAKMNKMAHDFLDMLPEKQREVMKQIYGIDGEAVPVSQIAEKKSVTASNINRIKAAALRKIYKYNSPELMDQKKAQFEALLGKM